MCKNKKNTGYVFRLLAFLCLIFVILSSCGRRTADEEVTTSDGIIEITVKDYASEVKLDMSSSSLKQKVTVKTYIDGDTTHFYVPEDVDKTGILKARYLAVNTPESTGKIEEYGKKASEFTKEKLMSAASIIIESDNDAWNADSTGSRYLVWVWYRTNEDEEYRNLNIELLQNGLAAASSSANNKYGEFCVSAISQAKNLKLNIYSGERDPDFYYGDAVELSLKELRVNIESYNGIKVAFEGTVTMNSDNSVFVEDYDFETGLYYGISVYYGYSLTGEGLDILSVGNRSRIVGTVQYYEAGGTYQISGVSYRVMRPDDPNNLKKLGEGNEPAFVKTDASVLYEGKVEVESNGEITVRDYAGLVLGTSVYMSDLDVISIYTTQNEESSSYGAMTFVCDSNGVPVKIRTAVLLDENKNVIKSEAYTGKNIDVRGIVDYYNGEYQIKVFSSKDIIVNN
ncbi:MAG: thermonuclease family protein [Firmicutes bacterium]|nr:thermonuclease family protein [Bacillota bacterium]